MKKLYVISLIMAALFISHTQNARAADGYYYYGSNGSYASYANLGYNTNIYGDQSSYTPSYYSPYGSGVNTGYNPYIYQASTSYGTNSYYTPSSYTPYVNPTAYQGYTPSYQPSYYTPYSNNYSSYNNSYGYGNNSWRCNSGYQTQYDNHHTQVGCMKIVVPVHASLLSSGNDWHCDSGYTTSYDRYSNNKLGCRR